MIEPLITVVVPSFNQGKYLEDALISVFSQNLAIEVFVMDGGSTDNSVDVIKKYEDKLSGWRSHKDNGQSAAINEGIKSGSAPYVCWLNSDDFFYKNGLKNLLNDLENNTHYPASYGRCWTTNKKGKKLSRYLTLPFKRFWFANYCFICQPGTLIRRSAWEAVGGLNEKLHMAMDYDLWWKLYSQFGVLSYCRNDVAATRSHGEAKTLNNTDKHYQESIEIVRKYNGTVPLKWKVALPFVKFIRLIEKIYQSR